MDHIPYAQILADIIDQEKAHIRIRFEHKVMGTIHIYLNECMKPHAYLDGRDWQKRS